MSMSPLLPGDVSAIAVSEGSLGGTLVYGQLSNCPCHKFGGLTLESEAVSCGPAQELTISRESVESLVESTLGKVTEFLSPGPRKSVAHSGTEIC